MHAPFCLRFHSASRIARGAGARKAFLEERPSIDIKGIGRSRKPGASGSAGRGDAPVRQKPFAPVLLDDSRGSRFRPRSRRDRSRCQSNMRKCVLGKADGGFGRDSRCCACGARATIHPPGIDPHAKATRRLMHFVCRLARCMPLSHIPEIVAVLPPRIVVESRLAAMAVRRPSGRSRPRCACSLPSWTSSERIRSSACSGARESAVRAERSTAWRRRRVHCAP